MRLEFAQSTDVAMSKNELSLKPFSDDINMDDIGVFNNIARCKQVKKYYTIYRRYDMLGYPLTCKR